jgi:hypothetical protein
MALTSDWTDMSVSMGYTILVSASPMTGRPSGCPSMRSCRARVKWAK